MLHEMYTAQSTPQCTREPKGQDYTADYGTETDNARRGPGEATRMVGDPRPVRFGASSKGQTDRTNATRRTLAWMGP